jgi:hypothetical protein
VLRRATQGESGSAQSSGGKDGGGVIIWICILAAVEYQDSMEPDSKAEIAALEKAFTDQSRQFVNQAAQANQRNDSEYWIAVCFQSRAQKEEFLRNAGLIADGDKYLDGQLVARKLGIALTPPPPPLKQGKIDKTWADMALEKE